LFATYDVKITRQVFSETRVGDFKLDPVADQTLIAKINAYVNTADRPPNPKTDILIASGAFKGMTATRTPNAGEASLLEAATALRDANPGADVVFLGDDKFWSRTTITALDLVDRSRVDLIDFTSTFQKPSALQIKTSVDLLGDLYIKANDPASFETAVKAFGPSISSELREKANFEFQKIAVGKIFSFITIGGAGATLTAAAAAVLFSGVETKAQEMSADLGRPVGREEAAGKLGLNWGDFITSAAGSAVVETAASAMLPFLLAKRAFELVLNGEAAIDILKSGAMLHPDDPTWQELGKLAATIEATPGYSEYKQNAEFIRGAATGALQVAGGAATLVWDILRPQDVRKLYYSAAGVDFDGNAIESATANGITIETIGLANGEVIRVHYDAVSMRRLKVEFLGVGTQFSPVRGTLAFNPDGTSILEFPNDAGERTRYNFDAVRRLSSVATSNGALTTFSIDGRLLSWSIPSSPDGEATAVPGLLLSWNDGTSNRDVFLKNLQIDLDKIAFAPPPEVYSGTVGGYDINTLNRPGFAGGSNS
jgi:hypothetical protein